MDNRLQIISERISSYERATKHYDLAFTFMTLHGIFIEGFEKELENPIPDIHRMKLYLDTAKKFERLADKHKKEVLRICTLLSNSFFYLKQKN